MNNKFSKYLQSFLTDYLINERNYSVNTQSSYAATFYLLLEFLEIVHNIKPNKIKFESINRELILEFLDWLENKRNASISTRNQRLAAIKSFYKYVQRNDSKLINTCSEVLDIEKKKNNKKMISYFSEEEIKLIIDYIYKTRDKKYLVMIAVLYESAIRVSELINIKISDLSLETATPSIAIRNGKGNKSRIVPISNELAVIIGRYLKNDYKNYGADYLFYTKFRKKYTRFGVYDLINRIINELKEKHHDKFKGNYHPHSFRHSKATHLYNNGTMLLIIKEFLGHSSVTATEIYATPDSKKIREQIQRGNQQLQVDEKYPESTKEELKEWLKSKLC